MWLKEQQKNPKITMDNKKLITKKILNILIIIWFISPILVLLSLPIINIDLTIEGIIIIVFEIFLLFGPFLIILNFYFK